MGTVAGAVCCGADKAGCMGASLTGIADFEADTEGDDADGAVAGLAVETAGVTELDWLVGFGVSRTWGFAVPLTTSDNLLSNTSPEDVLLCKQTNKVYSMSIIAFKMGYMAQWVECQTRHQIQLFHWARNSNLIA